MVVAIDLSTVMAMKIELRPRTMRGATAREQLAFDKPRHERTPADQWAVRRYLQRQYPASFRR